jgi:hypothetical protein
MRSEVRFTDAQRRAVGDELAPHLVNPDDLAAALREVQTLVADYVGTLESGFYEPDPPRRETLDELERLRAAADALAAALENLSEPTRERLTEPVHRTPDHAPDEPAPPDVLEPFVPPEVLGRSRRDARYLAWRFETLGAEVAREVRPSGKRPDWAARDFGARLAAAWVRFTGLEPRCDPGISPWSRFVAVCVGVAGVDVTPDYLARRIVAERRRALAESWPK